ncbi:MAG: hypoxanthine phosphoribosyltransferase [Deltaproteobacteria bacterium]|nr:hypoxanthine phosphoribosyltransferase [Deltaproteobacteria bacterium]
MNPESPAVLIPEERIQARVAELASRISADYARVDDLLLVGVLRGCYIFLADLSRRLTIPRSIDFIAVSSYGHSTKPTGAVRLIMDLRSDIAGKHVLIVDDIVDTGHTLHYLVNLFLPRGPASLGTCILVRKAERLERDLKIDYLGFDIPDVWVVGYGLDCADRHRALPYIGFVETGTGRERKSPPD